MAIAGLALSVAWTLVLTFRLVLVLITTRTRYAPPTSNRVTVYQDILIARFPGSRTGSIKESPRVTRKLAVALIPWS